MKSEVKNSLLIIFCLLIFTPVIFKASAADESALKTQFIGETCIVTGCDTSAEGTLKVPSEISGRRVTYIAENAFTKCKGITEIILPDTVVEIGNKAFSECTKLQSLVMTDSVELMGQGVFSQCISLQNVTLSSKLRLIPKEAFYKCTSLVNLTFPESVIALGDSAFYGCSSFKKLVLPEGIIDILSRCFSNCASLESICLPTTLKSIGVDAFEKCDELTDVYFTGNESDFEELEISSGNSRLEFADIKCNHDHIKQAKVTIFGADCTQEGYSVYNCPCGTVTRSNIVPASGHTLVFFKTEKEAACTSTGLEIYKCADCDYSEYRTVPAKGHNSVADSEVKASCTVKGKTKGSHCSRCNVVIKEQKEISALGHSYTLKIKDSKHLASKATYSKASKYYYSCARCKKISSKTFLGERLVIPKVKNPDFSSDTTAVTLKWKSIKAVRGYAVYKVDSKGKRTLIKRVRENSFKIKKLTAGTTYNYAVRAYVLDGKKIIYAPEYTAIKAATQPLPTAEITAKQNDKSISLSWKKSKGATGYRVYRYNTEKNKWITVCSYTKLNKLTVKKLSSGRKYKFAVKSCTDTGNKLVFSKMSESIITCTKPSKAVVKSTPYKYAVKLEWNKVKYADGYVVYMSDESNSGYKKVASTRKRTVKIDGLSSRKTYYFKVYSYRKLSDKIVYSYSSEIKKVKTR